jgi:protease-4
MKRLLLVFALLVVVAAAAAAVGILLADGPGAQAGDPIVLTWRLDRPVVEWSPEVAIPFATGEAPDTMETLYRALAGARDDDRVVGLAVYLQQTRFGLAKAQELRRQLTSLADRGKFVECYLETAGEGSNGTLAYYLASACDRIHLAPGGDLNLLGLYADSVFFRGTLEKLKIEPHYAASGRFKSAGETFTRNELSPESAEAVGAVLDSDFRQLVTGIAADRRLDAGRVRALVDGAPYDAAAALELGLIDGVAYPDEFRDLVEERAGGEPRLVSLRDYRPPRRRGGHTVAVAFAMGTIVRGTGGRQPLTDEFFLGSDEAGEMLRDLREDEAVDAVVLRIDSPGGSALASDLILREVELLAREKPVVVSMSDLAASGGYYIAAKATHIVAEAATLTGSIGVVGGKLVTRRFQDEFLGISHDTLQRGANADLYSSLVAFSPEQAARVRRDMDRVYRTFIDHVAAGRGLPAQEVEAVAEGRVWTGEDARERRLVDDLGGLDRAIELASEAAGIGPDEPVRLVFHPRQPSWFDMLLERREPALPASLAHLVRRLEARPAGVLELPPELASLAAPF